MLTLIIYLKPKYIIIYLKPKYILSVKITLKKRINDNESDPKTLCFNSLVKTVINRRYGLNDSFEEILNLLDLMG